MLQVKLILACNSNIKQSFLKMRLQNMMHRASAEYSPFFYYTK